MSEHVVVECPACGANESADPSALAALPAMVCRECGETWPVEDVETSRSKALAQKLAPPRRPEVIVAEKRPLVTYTDSRDDAWAGKIAGDYWPEPRRHSRIPAIAASMAALFFLAAFFGGREAAVAALPDLAGLYSAIGLPVNLDGFEIVDVRADRARTFGGTRLRVYATIRNVGHARQAIPSLAAVLYSEALTPAGAYGFDPPSDALAPGRSVQLSMTLVGVPAEATEVIVRFRRHGETLAAAGAAEPTAQ
jgi:hypothetical protein